MIYGLIGERLGHSYSVEIHRELGQPNYGLFELSKGEVVDFIKGREIGGLNVTIPYKKFVMPFCDTISKSAVAIGSVNTLVRDRGGKLHGYNTDYSGFCYMLQNARISLEGKKVLILGTGGTSLTAQTVAKDLRAKEVVIASRKKMQKLKNLGSAVPVHATCYGELEEHYDSEVVINTTPVGMYPNTEQSLISLKNFTKCGGVVDVIYNPQRTRLIMEALTLGIPMTDGLPMLVAQAKAAEELFTGQKIEEESLEYVTKKLRQLKANIVLIGMPGSGKTTVGRAVAKRLGKRFVDTDFFIEQYAGISIPQIFQEKGEDEFRRIEMEIASNVGKESGAVIATGGGIVLKKENYFSLKQNGEIFWIKRRIESLAKEGRPLSGSIETLEEMFRKRSPLYDHFSDKIIQNDGPLERAVQHIVQDFQSEVQ